MGMVWERHISNRIRAVGYDSTTKTLVVEFPGRKMVVHAPVPYELYASLTHTHRPERMYREFIEGKIPVVTG